MWIEVFLLLMAMALFFYRWATVNNDFFAKRGITYERPKFLMGSFIDMLTKNKSMYDVIIDLYRRHDGKVYGIFDQRQPLFIVRDPELIKLMAIRDFEHFTNHRNTFLKDDTKESHILGSSLIFLKNDKWKDMRHTLTPAFTSSKLRNTFSLITEVAQQACDFLREEQKDRGKNQGIDMELKDFAKRFTSDIIATIAFGVHVNSFMDKDNEFYVMSKKITTFTFWQNVKFVLLTNFGPLLKLLKVDLFDRKLTKYYESLVLDAMKFRHDFKIKRPDLINALMEARGLWPQDGGKVPKHEWNDTEMVAQCLLFFFAGFDTVATLISFTAYEMMATPHVQERLLEEITKVSKDLGNDPLTYDILQKMTYLDMVMSEVLRKWPGTLAVDRVCNKDITYDFGHGEKLHFKKGDVVWFPINALHMDGQYWDVPEIFNPERFSEQNKSSIKPFTYIPFGMGPRNCIGSRLALLEAKALLFYLVRDFHIEASEKTCQPFKLSTNAFELQPEGGFWLKLSVRAKKKKQ